MTCNYAAAQVWDCIIVGSGACGLSAGINGASEGLKTLIIDRETLTGGLIGTTSLIENYPGFPDGIEGRMLTNRMTEQAQRMGAQFMMSTMVHSISKKGNIFHVKIETLYESVEDRSIVTIYARSIILASGRNHKKLGLNNEQELVASGKLVYGHPATHVPIKGAVCIVGGGNSAGQAATWLVKNACSVSLVAPHLTNMSQYLVDRIKQDDSMVNLVIGKVTSVNSMTGDLLVYIQDDNGEHKTISVDRIYSLVGLEVDDSFRDMKNSAGFLYSDTPGIIIAGDCRENSEKRCTAAVGEGVMAVSEVHRYLATVNEIVEL